MPKFVVEVDDGGSARAYIQEFRDEARARELVTKRGFPILSIRLATEADLSTAEEQKAHIEDRKAHDAYTHALESGDWSHVPPSKIVEEAKRLILTTAFVVAGRTIERELEIITAECAYGINLFRDLFVEVRDVFGGRSGATQKVLRDARHAVLTELKREALMVGADAVIGVDLAYSEFSSSKMLFVVASGTAVKLKGNGS